MDVSPYILLAAALLPAAVLMLFILRRDREHPEPVWQLVKAFLYGVVSVFVSTLFSTPFVSSGILPNGYYDAFTATIYSFGAAAIPEETAKLIMLWLFLRKNEEFDEHLDGVVYAVCVGLGFAAVENVQRCVFNVFCIGTSLSRCNSGIFVLYLTDYLASFCKNINGKI